MKYEGEIIMKYRKIIAVLTSLLLASAAYSCGKTDPSDTESSVNGNVTVTHDSAENTTASKETDKKTEDSAKKPDSNEKTTTTSKNDKTDNTSTTTASSADKNNEPTTVKNPSGETNNQKPATNTTPSAPEEKPTEKPTENSGTPNNGEGTSSGDTPQTPPPEEVKTYTAEITFGSTASVKGENVTTNGSVVTITAGGDYLISGSVTDGQLCVSTATEEKVKIILNNVNIANSSGPAIFINEAKRCTIELADGTTSTLSDGAKDKINDGVIFSNDTLRIKGSGTLNINSNNAHGIASDDDVIIDGGTYNINSIKSGIIAHDDITINDGILNIKGGTNGLNSKGTININGGRSIISGGTKEEKSSIFAAGPFSYTGGYVFAAGNMVSPPTSAVNPYVVVDLGKSVAAGSNVAMILNGTEFVNFAPHNNFRCLMMLAPDISSGNIFKATVNGSTAVESTVSNGQNLFSGN